MQYQRVPIVRRNSQRGSAIVELTLLVPLFLLMLLGTMDFARVFYAALSVSLAAGAGVQYGAQDNGKSRDYGGMQRAARLAARDIGPRSIVPPEGVPISCAASCAA